GRWAQGRHGHRCSRGTSTTDSYADNLPDYRYYSLTSTADACRHRPSPLGPLDPPIAAGGLTIAAGRVTLRNRDSCPYLGEHRARASLWRSLSFGLLLATRFLLKPRSANRESRGLPARSPGPCGANPVAAGRGDA